MDTGMGGWLAVESAGLVHSPPPQSRLDRHVTPWCEKDWFRGPEVVAKKTSPPIVALAGTDMTSLVGLVWGWVKEKPCVWYVYVYVGCTESFVVRPRP